MVVDRPAGCTYIYIFFSLCDFKTVLSFFTVFLLFSKPVLSLFTVFLLFSKTVLSFFIVFQLFLLLFDVFFVVSECSGGFIRKVRKNLRRFH